MKDNYEQKFEKDGLDKKIKKMKRKSLLKTMVISLIVTTAVSVIAYTLNKNINIKEMEKAFKKEETTIKLTIPNGYILEASYEFGILGGQSEYKIAREIGPKSVILKDYKVQFGSLNRVKSGVYGSGIRYVLDEDEKSPGFWENGYRRMIFYHPEIEYKSYKNDLELLNEIPDGKIIEMGISFDKEYDISELNNIIPDIKKSWVGLNLFTDEYMQQQRDEAKNYDANASYISEGNIVGISMHRVDGDSSVIQKEIRETFNLLKESSWKEHNRIYKKYYNEDDEEIPGIISTIVYGTKDELIKLKGNPNIKAASIGVVEDLY